MCIYIYIYVHAYIYIYIYIYITPDAEPIPTSPGRGHQNYVLRPASAGHALKQKNGVGSVLGS